MCIYSPMPHTLSYCALIGKCALIRSNTVGFKGVILKIIPNLSGALTGHCYDNLTSDIVPQTKLLVCNVPQKSVCDLISR